MSSETQETSDKFYSITVIIIIIILLACIAGVVVLKIMGDTTDELRTKMDILEQKDYNHKLDSIELLCMEKTMLVAYPRLSEYEAKYYSIIYIDMACKYGVDWKWFPAMMWIESRFNPTAKSEDDAHNLTQVIEPTLKIQCDKLGIKYKKNTKWHDIHMMIAGIDYLCQGFEKGEEYAVKRYIGGPGYKKAAKESDQEDIKAYWDSVSTEANKVKYIYRGIISEEYKLPKMRDFNAMLSRIQ